MIVIVFSVKLTTASIAARRSAKSMRVCVASTMTRVPVRDVRRKPLFKMEPV
jgi:hypothetical protein